MKKKLFLLAAFMALNVAAQNLPKSSIDWVYQNLPAHNYMPKASMQVKLDSEKELLKIRASLPITEIIIEDLNNNILIRRKNTNSIRLSELTRGVYTLVVHLEGTRFRKRIILH